MKKNLITAILYTSVTTVLLGIAYPLLITALAPLISKDKANRVLDIIQTKRLQRHFECIGDRRLPHQ